MDRLKKIFRSFSEKERLIFLTATALVAISILTLGVVLVRKTTRAVPTSGGELTEGWVGQPTFINPVLATSEIDRSLTRLLFGRLEKLITQSEGDKEGKVWKIRIKEDEVWSDGEKLTSDDVVFTVQKIQDEDARSPLAREWRGVAITRVSELEVKFTLASPNAFFLRNLLNLYLLPKHIFKNVPAANWRISDYNLKPVGNGPYRFLDYDKEKSGFITRYYLEANTSYAGGKAFIKKFNFAFFPEKQQLVAAFNRGEVSGLSGLEEEEIDKIRRSYESFSFRLPNYYAVFINQSKNPALKELAVRKALSLAAPREQLVRDVLGAKGQPEFGPVPPGAPHFHKIEKDDGGTLEEAKLILEAAGWQIAGDKSGESGEMPPSDFRQKAVKGEVVSLKVNLVVPQIPFLIKTAETLKGSWKNLGAEVQVTATPTDETLENIIRNRDYEMMLYGNILSAESDLFPFWHSSQRFYPGLNFSLYSNNLVDSLTEEVRQIGSKEGQDQFDKLQEVIGGDYPAIFLYSPDYIYLTDTNLKGVTEGFIAEPADRFKEVTQWHLKTVRILK